MAGEFNAGGGRIYITGDATGATKATEKATEGLEGIADKGKSAGGILKSALAAIAFPAAAIAAGLRLVRIIVDIATSSERANQAISEMGVEGSRAIAKLIQNTSLGDYEKQLRAIDEATRQASEGLAKAAESSRPGLFIQGANETSAWIKGLLGFDPTTINDEIDRALSGQLDRQAQLAERARQNVAAQRVAAIKKEAEQVAREMMSVEERAAAEHKERDARISELRTKNLTDEQRKELDAAQAVFAAREKFIKKEKELRSEAVGLEDLARRFDLSPLLSVMKENTAAVKGLKLNGRPGPGIKD